MRLRPGQQILARVFDILADRSRKYSVFTRMVCPVSQQRSADDFLYKPLKDADTEVHDLIIQEMHRQQSGLELIASENFTSVAVMEACGSILTNKYSEGLPGARYYGGNEYIDRIELLCQRRALEAFHLNPEQWGVNVQPYSGSPANFEVYTAVLQPGDSIMGLDLPSGGHLTHGFQTEKKKISSSSIYFKSHPYQVDPNTGYIDYDGLEKQAMEVKPKLIICGASAYPRELDYARLRGIANKSNSLLMADISHISGLILSGQAANCFSVADIVTTTTHKTLRGPRAAMIFFRKHNPDGSNSELEEKINFSVFPSCQGGPHNNTIAAIAVALKQANTPDFHNYCKQVVTNSKHLAQILISHGYKLVTDGTDNHLLVVDLRPQGITGNKLEKVCDLVHITINKNAVYGDKSALSPGGVRLGTPALTTRGLKEKDFEKVAEFIHEAINITLKIQQSSSSKLFKDFVEAIPKFHPEIQDLQERVTKFSQCFPLPGFNAK